MESPNPITRAPGGGEFLVEGRYSIEDLVDLDRLRGMFENFSAATGFTTGLVTFPGQKLLIATGWHTICTAFHRHCPESAAHCLSSNIRLTSALTSVKETSIVRCENGLVDAATPVIIRGVHVASLATGQVLLEPPDQEAFRKRAAEFGYDTDAYLKALQEVPVITEGKIRKVLEFLGELAELIAEEGLRNLEAMENARLLRHERHAAAAARDLLGDILDSIPQAVFWKDRDYVYRGCNKTFARIVGKEDSSGVVGKTDYDLPQEAEDVRAYRRDDAEIMDFNRPKRHIIEEVQMASGKRIWVDTTKVPLHTSQGEVCGVLGVFEDITERKELQDRLLAEQSFNKAVLDNAESGIVACDIRGKLVTFNQTARQWHGRGPEDLPISEWSLAYNLFDRNGVSPLPPLGDPVCRAFHGEHLRNFEMAIIAPGQPLRFVSANASPILDADGQKLGAVAIMYDITSLREKESRLLDAVQRANQANQAKSEFLAVMSHEIRTPLNGVIGYCSLMETTALTSEQKDFVQNINSCGDSLLQVINSVLDFSKIEAGKVVTDIQTIRIRDLVDDVCKILLPHAVQKGLSLEHSAGPAVPEWIRSDDLRLRQILTNLIVNAIKFTGSGGVRIDIQAEERPGGHEVRFHVIDTGIGIAPEAIDHLFEPFTQADSSHTRRYGGTGLGLSISQRLSALLGGSITVESTPGSGSEFVLKIFSADDPDGREISGDQ